VSWLPRTGPLGLFDGRLRHRVPTQLGSVREWDAHSWCRPTRCLRAQARSRETRGFDCPCTQPPAGLISAKKLAGDDHLGGVTK
jgi:hypothetical protein